jgi:hypothetical protein
MPFFVYSDTTTTTLSPTSSKLKTSQRQQTIYTTARNTDKQRTRFKHSFPTDSFILYHSRTQTLLIPESRRLDLGNPNLPEARILLQGHQSTCSDSWPQAPRLIKTLLGLVLVCLVTNLNQSNSISFVILNGQSIYLKF